MIDECSIVWNTDLNLKDMNKSCQSYDMDGETFVKGNVAINSRGVMMRDSNKRFTVVSEELEEGIPIGRGCSSVVLKSKHIPSGTPLALKVINLFDKSKRDQLIREIQTLYDAQCPCLITFYGAFYRNASISIALEYMDGGSLQNVTAQVGCIPEKALANMTYQILYGLAYLKTEKRVHRDIKPSNMLINSKGEVKVTDFGIAAELGNSIAMCATFVGTFKYMSPERIQRAPYRKMIQTILESPPPSLSPEYFTLEFCDFISNCVKKKPSDRLPADILLGSPWLQRFGAVSLESSRCHVLEWIRNLAK